MKNPFKRQVSDKDIKKYLDQKGLMAIPESQEIMRALYHPILGMQNLIISADNTKQFIDNGYVGSADVYSIVRQISRSCSVPSWEAFEVKNEKALNDYKRLKLSKDNTESQLFKLNKLKTKALEEIDDNRAADILRVFDKPNPLMDWTEFYELSIVFRLVTGNRYWVSSAPEFGANAGLIQELYSLPSQWVEIIGSNDWQSPIHGYRINFNPQFEMDADKVSHSKYPNPQFDTTGQSLYGLSPLKPGKLVLTKSIEGYTATASMLQNLGARGIISPKNADANVDNIALDKKYNEKFMGDSSKTNKMMFPSVPMEYQHIGLNAVDMAINDGQMLTLRQLCNIYNYPSELLNDKESNKFNSHKEAKKSAVINAAIPELNLDRDTFNSDWYIKPFEDKYNKKLFVDYNVTDMPELQEDLEKLWARVDNSWEIPPNEKRALKGLDRIDIPELDVPWVPFNLMPISSIGESTDTEEVNKMLKELGVYEYSQNGKN